MSVMGEVIKFQLSISNVIWAKWSNVIHGQGGRNERCLHQIMIIIKIFVMVVVMTMMMVEKQVPNKFHLLVIRAP